MNPYGDTFETYWAAGWRGVLPLPYKAKKNPPAGFTGSTGIDPSYPDCATWAMDGDRNICLRMPAHVIGIDVDAYGDKAGALTLAAKEEQWGPLPATWRSTSRDDGVSGIRLYRVPEGLKWPGEVGAGIETVRRDHRYVVCWPSIHPDTGSTYRWIDPDGLVAAHGIPDPDTLPWLPDAWVDGLTGGEMAPEIHRNSLQDDAAMLWIASLPNSSQPACDRVKKASQQLTTDLRDHSAHQTALAATSRLLRLGDEGHAGIVEAVLGLKAAFIAEVTRPERRIMDKTIRTPAEAEREWQDILVSGVNFVSANPAGLPVCDCDGLLTAHIVGDMPPQATEAEPAAPPTTTAAPAQPYPQLVDGASFILNAPEQPPAIWGYMDDVIWSEGEALVIVGPPGVGKTTIGGQVVKCRLKGGSVLGYGVTPTRSKVLYLAMDRPAQIARSLRRHFAEDDRQLLADKLVVWKGPPPADVAKNTGILVSLVKLAGADTLIVDSIKDAAIGLSSDEVGAAYNQARQLVLAAGAEVMELHHLVKRGPNGAKPTQLADVYGSTWITSGAGSVLLVWGQPGDYIVELTHLKQPSNDIGPLKVEHDHASGTSEIFLGEDGEHAPLEAAMNRHSTIGWTKHSAALHLFGTDDPTENQKRKAKEKLDALVDKGVAYRIDGGGRGHETMWWLTGHGPNKPDNKPDNSGNQVYEAKPDRSDDQDHSPHKKPDNKPDKTGSPKHDQPTLSVRQGVGLGAAQATPLRACEDCGNDTGSKGFIFCSECEQKRRRGSA